jgi:hypothetical protein
MAWSTRTPKKSKARDQVLALRKRNYFIDDISPGLIDKPVPVPGGMASLFD